MLQIRNLILSVCLSQGVKPSRQMVVSSEWCVAGDPKMCMCALVALWMLNGLNVIASYSSVDLSKNMDSASLHLQL